MVDVVLGGGGAVASTVGGGVVSISDFEVLNELGSGGYGKVYRVRLDNKRQKRGDYALKVLKKSEIDRETELEHVKAELGILREVQHPFVVSLMGTFQTPRLLCFVLEFVSGGDLHSRLVDINLMNESQAKFYMLEILLGLEYLHSCLGVVFRDLKPENVLMDGEGHVKLCDFGLSRRFFPSGEVSPNNAGFLGGHPHHFNHQQHCPNQSRPRRLLSYCGTVEYMAPEMVGRKGHSFPVDWWAFGVLFYDLTCGGPPFASTEEEGGREETVRKILESHVRFPRECGLSPEAKTLIIELLEKDEEFRLGTMNRVRDHPYFSQVDWTRVLAREIRPPYIPVQVLQDETVSGRATTPATEKDVIWGSPSGSDRSSSSLEEGELRSPAAAPSGPNREDVEAMKAAVFNTFDWASPALLALFKDTTKHKTDPITTTATTTDAGAGVTDDTKLSELEEEKRKIRALCEAVGAEYGYYYPEQSNWNSGSSFSDEDNMPEQDIFMWTPIGQPNSWQAETVPLAAATVAATTVPSPRSSSYNLFNDHPLSSLIKTSRNWP